MAGGKTHGSTRGEPDPSRPLEYPETTPDHVFEVRLALSGMTVGAVEHVEKFVQRFCDDLARETARLEEGDRATDLEDPEITSTTVVRAHEVVRRGPDEPVSTKPTSRWWYALGSGVYLTTILTGVLGSYLNSTLQWVTFVVLLIASVAGTAVTIWRKP